MRAGFEDWEFFLSLLETQPDAHIGIVPEPLLEYRTAPASSNIQSMSKRLDLMRFLIEKHLSSYQAHLTDALLSLESISMTRLDGWEAEMRHALQAGQRRRKGQEAHAGKPCFCCWVYFDLRQTKKHPNLKNSGALF